MKQKRSHWEDVPGYPIDAWKLEVQNDDTRLGYADWVAAQMFTVVNERVWDEGTVKPDVTVVGGGPLIVMVDESDGGWAITWNGSLTFNVWTALTNGFSTTLCRNVNVFIAGAVPQDVKEAEQIAADWWRDCGREDTFQVVREEYPT
jgi:hypothetical protein